MGWIFDAYISNYYRYHPEANDSIDFSYIYTHNFTFKANESKGVWVYRTYVCSRCKLEVDIPKIFLRTKNGIHSLAKGKRDIKYFGCCDEVKMDRALS